VPCCRGPEVTATREATAPRFLGLGSALAAFQREESVLTDALTYCDLLTGPTGTSTSLRERVADVGRRYGEGTLVVDALREALPALRGAVERTRLRLGGERQAAIG
jgi:hypothetical protein